MVVSVTVKVVSSVELDELLLDSEVLDEEDEEEDEDEEEEEDSEWVSV